MFLILTYVGDVKTLEPQQRLSVANAVEGMNESQLNYKGMMGYQQKILSILKS